MLSTTNRKVDLLAADYGRLFQVSLDEVSAFPPELEELKALPFQAIECYLDTVVPKHGQWTDESGDLIWQTFCDCTSLFVKVITQAYLIYKQ